MTAGQARPGLAGEQAVLRPGTAGAEADMSGVVDLPRQDGGLAGVVFASIGQGAHGTRVSWHPGRVAPRPTVTSDAPPRLISHGSPERDARATGRQVAEPVSLDREALLRFRHGGLSRTPGEVDAFVAAPVKLP